MKAKVSKRFAKRKDRQQRVNAKLRRQHADRKRRIQRRLDKENLQGCGKPMFTANFCRYEYSERCRGLGYGGIGAMHQLAKNIGLLDAIDKKLFALKIHLPYHESDHVANIAYIPLSGGTCLQDLELLRNDEAYLDALGARRIPDPTTAGDFCRRFDEGHILTLQDLIDDVRIGVWAEQPPEFFVQAKLDMDGTLVGTTGECKQGMDMGYDRTWGYHVFVLTLANTGEIMRLVNRPANRPSHEGAAAQVDRALATCFRGGFQTALLRGDTDFSQTEYLDGWNADKRVQFIFGYDAKANLNAIADGLPADAWRPLERPAKYEVKTKQRTRPDNVKEAVIIERKYENLKLLGEDVAEFHYRPTACEVDYRMVVIRKDIAVEKGGVFQFDKYRYFYYITNDRVSAASEIVFLANDRCNQENILEQLKNGVRALRAPVNTLLSNWAYMVMTALSWNLKAWWALKLPEGPGRWQEKYQAEKRWVLKLEFKAFANAFIRIPCQLVKSSRQLVYRLLSWNPYQPIFFRLVAALRC